MSESAAPVQYIAADLRQHRAALLDLNIEYFSWVVAQVEQQFGVTAQQVLGLSAAEYVPTVIDAICGKAPPHGIFYLVRSDDRWVGMGGLRGLDTRTAEIKRLYVRDEYRGRGLGGQIVQRLLADARSFGYMHACLDSALFQQAAHRLYERHGFIDCPEYPGVEVPAQFRDRWRFMARSL